MLHFGADLTFRFLFHEVQNMTEFHVCSCVMRPKHENDHEPRPLLMPRPLQYSHRTKTEWCLRALFETSRDYGTGFDIFQPLWGGLVRTLIDAVKVPPPAFLRSAASIRWRWCTADSARCSRWPAGSGSPRRGRHRAAGPIWWADGKDDSTHQIRCQIGLGLTLMILTLTLTL